MPIKLLGKLLFPHAPAWQQRRRARTFLSVLLIALVFAAIASALMFYANAKR